MEDPNSTLLPYILETLSRTPELCDTFENLCKNVHQQLIQEQNGRYANVRLAIQRALNVGQSLGIISLNNDTIRVPFNFRQNKNYRNMNHFQLNAQPMDEGFLGTNPQKQNQNNQQSKNAQQKKDSERNLKTKKEDEEARKYVRQLELDDSDYSLESSTSDRDTRSRSRSRSTSRRRPRERSYSRPKARRPNTRSRGRYVRRR